jgi:general secretion pathway protein G
MARGTKQTPSGASSSNDMSRRTFVLSAAALILVAVAGCLHPFRWYQEYSRQAKVKTAKMWIEVRFAAALDTFKAKVGRYPTTAEGLHVLTTKGTDEGGGEGAPLLRRIPRDPWGNEYQYTCPGEHNVDSYDLYSFGPDGKPGTGDDITNWEQATAKR